ncbi:FAD:protein FMN transferase [Paenibacillus sp. HB172176]|uniref:FAD:protein FMN transferase n=1 Tax=Paenibacillus sp. HB172176 TaxID=2493690 RepID=UPI00143AB4D9|nr:FAD:protein FMN transferase [Paenibacillus sp. HB172176]
MMNNHIQFRAMNTDISAIFPAIEEKRLDSVLRAAKQFFERSEIQFSRFRKTSELCDLNRKAGSLSLISDDMAEVLELAEHYYEMTEGWFDITILNALEAEGYDQTFERLASTSANAIQDNDDSDSGRSEATRSTLHLFAEDNCRETSPSLYPLKLNRRMRSMQMPEDCSIDLGGLVKSWTVKRLAAYLRRDWGVARGLINAGGDLMAWGGYGDDEPWRVGYEDPWNPEMEFGQASFRNGAMATSSTLGRRWATDEGVKHHLINPRTRSSGQSDVAQCTVIGADPVICEVWAKTLCLCGGEAGAELLLRNAPDYEAQLFTKSKEMIWLRRAEYV